MGKKNNMSSSTGLVEVIELTDTFTFDPKEGIDNPVMVITDDTDSAAPRLCVLRRDEGESYGFYLRLEKGCNGHLIRNVTSGGVAESSGLRDGDRLLEVNNCYVDDVPHPEVARKIKLSGNQLSFLVLDGNEYEEAKCQGKDLRALVRGHKGEGYLPPRLCHISRDPASGLGINFTPLGGLKGRFSISVSAGGAAERAGVRQGDHLVWMDGATVSDLTHAALSKMMKKFGDHITIVVIDSESEKKYQQLKMPILPTMAVPHKLPYRARKLNLVSGPKGYGFLLKFEKAPSGRTSHVLRDVSSGSPAERAGMKDGELLLEVNGESVESLKHQEIVERVRQSGQQVSLTTIAAQGLEFYHQLGLSPLLFCVDVNGRHCSVQKGPLGFGFDLGYVPDSPGTYIKQVVSGGPGESAGLLVEDVVVEVNGQNVEDKYREEVIMIMKERGNSLSLLVMDKDDYDRLKQADAPTPDITNNEEEDNYEISFL